MFTEESAENRPQKGVWAASVVLHVLLIAVMIAIPAQLAKRAKKPEKIDIVFYPPDAVKPTPVEPPKPKPVEIAKVEPPPVEIPKPKPLEVKPEPKPEPKPLPPVARNEPPPRPRVEPKPVVPTPKPKVGEFTESPVAEAKPKPKREVKTAGFATTTTAQQQKSRKKAVRDVGGFDVAKAQPAPQPNKRNRVVSSASFSNSNIKVPKQNDAAPRGSVTQTAFNQPASAASTEPVRTRDRGQVQTAGFTGSAAEAPSNNRPASGSVQQGSFGDGVGDARPVQRRERPKENPDKPVEIVSKVKPVYTAEAREQRIEGEVVLEVTFVKTGDLVVHRVVGSLGHGLDEAAIAAAKKIKFQAARRDGQPVDHTATLRVVFRLA